MVNIAFTLSIRTKIIVNSVDPDYSELRRPRLGDTDRASDQGVHCLLFYH